jgi:hypothetical protein
VSSSAASSNDLWKAHRDQARRFESEASRALALSQRSRYYRLAGASYLQAATLAPYDRQDLMASHAAHCFDSAASLIGGQSDAPVPIDRYSPSV